MKWYEIIGLVILVIVGAFIGSKLMEYRKNYFSGHNDSWRDKKK